MEEVKVWLLRYKGDRFELVKGKDRKEAVLDRSVLGGVVSEVIELGTLDQFIRPSAVFGGD